MHKVEDNNNNRNPYTEWECEVYYENVFFLYKTGNLQFEKNKLTQVNHKRIWH